MKSKFRTRKGRIDIPIKTKLVYVFAPEARIRLDDKKLLADFKEVRLSSLFTLRDLETLKLVGTVFTERLFIQLNGCLKTLDRLKLFGFHPIVQFGKKSPFTSRLVLSLVRGVSNVKQVYIGIEPTKGAAAHTKLVPYKKLFNAKELQLTARLVEKLENLVWFYLGVKIKHAGLVAYKAFLIVQQRLKSAVDFSDLEKLFVKQERKIDDIKGEIGFNAEK